MEWIEKYVGKFVIAAMSGGVDSSVAAALLLQQGYEVTGITMCFNLPDPESGKPVCCGPSAISDAKRIAGILGIRHYVLNFGEELKEKVIGNFISEYGRGRTPNPCIRCNDLLKFDSLLKKSVAFGAEYLVTGHYARILSDGASHRLAKARDIKKDQSYFLYRLKSEQMRGILFPLGELAKSEVREVARELKLPVADKSDSQEICFIRDKDEFIRAQTGLLPGHGPGHVFDTAGKVIGSHRGAHFYTVGQRRGLGIAAEHPLYVLKIDAADNTIVAGRWDEGLKTKFAVADIVWPGEAERDPFSADVRIRHNHKPAPACIRPGCDTAIVEFEQPQFAITPGQSAVFYNDDVIIGGGVIESVFD